MHTIYAVMYTTEFSFYTSSLSAEKPCVVRTTNNKSVRKTQLLTQRCSIASHVMKSTVSRN